MRMLFAVLASVLGAAAAQAEGPKPQIDRSMVVLDFTTSSPADEPRAQAVTALVTAELQKRPGAKLVTSGDVRQLLGVERQKQLLGCNEGSSCMAEIGGALGAKYILSGQLTRLGQKFLLSASVVDARTARSVARSAQTLDREEDLPQGAHAIAGEVADAVGLAPEPTTANEKPGVALDIKFGNAIPALTGGQQLSLRTLNLRLDLELGYFVTRSIEPFLGASLTLAGSSNGESLRFIPVLLGSKFYFRTEHDLRPYLGAGVGLGFIAGKLTGDQSTNTSFALRGIGGLAYFPWKRVGFNAEISANLSGVEVSATSGVLLTYNFDFGVMVLFF